jgi:hypothetical protein
MRRKRKDDLKEGDICEGWEGRWGDCVKVNLPYVMPAAFVTANGFRGAPAMPFYGTF